MARGDIFIVSGVFGGARVHRYHLMPDGSHGWSGIDLGGYPELLPEGILVNPDNGQIAVLDRTTNQIYRRVSASVRSVTITNPGSGYTSVPTVIFGAPSADPSSRIATGTAIISEQTVVGVEITDPGLGYVTAPSVTFNGGGGSGAAGIASFWDGIDDGIKLPSGAVIQFARTLTVYDHNGNLVICDLIAQSIFRRNNTAWDTISFPSGVSDIRGMTIDLSV